MKPKTKRNFLILIYLGVLQVLFFYGPRLIVGTPETHPEYYHVISLPWDSKIPFVPAFVLIYAGAFIQWANYYLSLLLGKDSRLLHRFLPADLIAKTTAFLFYILLPTTMVRPVLDSKNFFQWIVGIVFSADTPTNLLPSMHCAQSWFCMRAALANPQYSRWGRVVSVVFTLLVCASVVLVRQHLLLDIPAGILLAEFALFVSDRAKLSRIPAKLFRKFETQEESA